MMSIRAATVVLALLFGASACGISIPQDPDGTLETVTGGTLRVGVSENAGWVELPAAGSPHGLEPELVKEFGETLQAAVEWVPGVEHELVEDLHHGELDLVIGGFADNTSWVKDVGMTRPYTETLDERGKTVKHVMLVPLGENAFLLKLDQFLLAQEVEL